MFNYVELDEDDIVVVVKQVNEEEFGDRLIPIEDYNPSLIGKRYDFETKKFVNP